MTVDEREVVVKLARLLFQEEEPDASKFDRRTTKWKAASKMWEWRLWQIYEALIAVRLI